MFGEEDTVSPSTRHLQHRPLLAVYNTRHRQGHGFYQIVQHSACNISHKSVNNHQHRQRHGFYQVVQHWACNISHKSVNNPLAQIVTQVLSNSPALGLQYIKSVTKLLNSVYIELCLNRQFQDCPSWLFITVHGHVKANGLGLWYYLGNTKERVLPACDKPYYTNKRKVQKGIEVL